MGTDAASSSAVLTLPEHDASAQPQAQTSHHHLEAQQQPHAPPPQQVPDWLAPHQQVFNIFVNAFFAACALAGGYYWVRWGILQMMASKGAKQQSTPGQTVAPAQSSSTGHTADDLGPSANAAVVQDNLDDPFAPIKYLLRPKQAAPSFGTPPDNRRSAETTISTRISSNTHAPSSPGSRSALQSTPSEPQQLSQAATVAPTTSNSSSGIMEAGGLEGSGLHVYTPLAPAAMDPGWWSTLGRCYYINCGTK
jgi:hypothetical protein